MPLHSKRSADLLPKEFAKLPMVKVLTDLLDSLWAESSPVNPRGLGIDREIGDIAKGGIIPNDRIGYIRSAELGSSILTILLSGGDKERLLTLSKITELFSTIKGTRKAIVLAYLLIGVRATIVPFREVEHDRKINADLKRKYGIETKDMKPCDIIVYGVFDESSSSALTRSYTGVQIDTLFENLAAELMSICTNIFAFVFFEKVHEHFPDLESSFIDHRILNYYDGFCVNRPAPPPPDHWVIADKCPGDQRVIRIGRPELKFDGSLICPVENGCFQTSLEII